MALKFGICLRFTNPAPWTKPWQQVYREHLVYAREAERLGFDGIWVPEHHSVESGYNPAPFLALGALAGQTQHCWLGTQPLLLPLHHPVHIAEQAAVLDVLSGGRLILGIGAGYLPGDFAALGVGRAERGARMEEGTALLLETMRARKAFDFAGDFYRVRGVCIHPRPLQSPHPEVVMCVRSRPAAERAGRFGLSVNLQGPESLRRNGPLVVEAREKAGFGASRAGASILRSGFLGATREASIAASREYYAHDLAVYDAWQRQQPDPDDLRMLAARSAGPDAPGGLYEVGEWIAAITSDAESMRDAGLVPDWINLTLWPPGMAVDEALGCLQRFAAEVLPRVRGL